MDRRPIRVQNYKTTVLIVVAAIFLISLAVFFLKKPAITGLVVTSEEKTFRDELGLTVNESGNVTWVVSNPGDLKSIKATGSIAGNGSAKVYLKKGDEKVLLFDSTKPLFDVNVKVLPEYKKIFQGDELLIQIVLFNLRGFGKVDVDVKYSIKNDAGDMIAAEEEKVTVETQSTFVRKLVIPSDLKPGTYTAFVEVTTPDGTIGTSSDLFEVTAKYEGAYPKQTKQYILILTGIFIAVIVIIFALPLYRKLKQKKDITKLKEGLPEEEISKLEKELNALESAYNSKLLSEASYKKDKDRIENRLRILGAKGQKEERQMAKEEKESSEESEEDNKKDFF